MVGTRRPSAFCRDTLTAPDVLVFNGDVLCGTDLTAVVDTHRRTKADATLHLVRVQDPRAYGCVPTDEAGSVLDFLEKTEDPPTDQINAGCYVFRREVLERLGVPHPGAVQQPEQEQEDHAEREAHPQHPLARCLD